MSIHMMGQMGAITPAIVTKKTIPRSKVSMDDIRTMGRHKLIFQKDPKAVLTKIKYPNIREFSRDPQNTKLDLMWQISLHVSHRHSM